MPSAAAFLDELDAEQAKQASKPSLGSASAFLDSLDAELANSSGATHSAASFLDAIDGGEHPAQASKGFLSSIAQGLTDLGNTDAATVTTLGRKAANLGKDNLPARELLAHAEEKHGIRPGLLDSIAHTESRYNPDAISPKGAAGIMQFMPATARQYRIDPHDMPSSIDAGGKHVAYLLNKYAGDEAKAVAAYNWGEGNLDRALAKNDGQDWRAHLPAETYDYLGKVLGAKASGIPKELYGLPVSPVAVEQVRDQYSRLPADDRAKLVAQDDTQGRIARAVDAEYQRFNTSQMGHSPEIRAASGGRMEDKALGYRLQGVEPGTALSLAASDAVAAMPAQKLSTAMDGNTPMGLGDETVQASKRGLVNLRQMGAGLGAWASDVLGDEDAVNRLMDDYQGLEAEAAKLPASVATLGEIHGGGDLAKWATNAIYSNLPMMLPSLAAGGIGGLTARAAAKRAFAGLAEKFGAEKAAQIVANRISTAAGAGAGASSIGMETGSIYGDIRQQTGQGHPGIALAAGIPAGLLDTLPDMMVLRKALGAGAAKQVADGLVQRFGLPVAKQMLAEGATEGAQTAIERGAASVAGGNAFLTRDTLSDIVESMAQGAVAGGVMGGGMEAAGQAQPIGLQRYDGLNSSLHLDKANYGQRSLAETRRAGVDVADNAGGKPLAANGLEAGNLLSADGVIVGDAGRGTGENPAVAAIADNPVSDPNSIAARAGITPTPAPTARIPKLRDAPIKPVGDSESLLSAVAKLGGIDAGEAIAQGIDTPYVKGKGAIKGHGIFKVFTGTGQSFDAMAENLRQYGFPVEGANDLLAQLSNAINTKERGHATDLDKMAAEHDDTARQMEAAKLDDAMSLSPGFEFQEDDYTPEMDDKGRHMLELATHLNRIEDGAGDAIIERHAIANEDHDHTIQTLESAIAARTSFSEAKGKQRKRALPTPSQPAADLFGNYDPTAQALADLERQKAAKRNGDGAGPGELFPGAGQTDIEDAKSAVAAPTEATSAETEEVATLNIPTGTDPDAWAKGEQEARQRWAMWGQGKRKTILRGYGHDLELSGQSWAHLPERLREDLTVGRVGFKRGVKADNKMAGQDDEPRFSFAGEKAQTADHEALKQAKAMEAEGKPEKAIWQATGWFRAPWDNRWRFEISDAYDIVDLPNGELGTVGADWMTGDKGFAEPLADGHTPSATVRGLMRHNELFKAYPHLSGIPVTAQDDAGASYGKGGISINRSVLKRSSKQETLLDTEQAKSHMLHELQHGIQAHEKTATGGNPKMFKPLDITKKRLDKIQKEKQNLYDSNPDFYSAVITANQKMMAVEDKYKSINNADLDDPIVKDWWAAIDKRESFPENERYMDLVTQEYKIKKEKPTLSQDEQYRLLAGEAEARLVQRRMSFTPKERREQFPLDTLRKMLKAEGLDPGANFENLITRFDSNPSAKLAQEQPLPYGQTAQAVRKALSRTGRELEQAGLLRIVQRGDQLPIKTGTKRYRGLYHQGMAYLVADYIPAGREMGVLLHEVGEHQNLEAMLGADRYAKLAAEAERILAAGGPLADAVNKAIPKTTKAHHLASERIAYLIEYVTHADEAERATWTGGVRVWAAKLLAALRAWFYQTKFYQSLESKGVKMTPTARDLAALARAAVDWRLAQEGRGQADGEAMPEGARASTPGEFKAQEVRDSEGRLLAPNGKPSKLNERQWHQVRSPEFIKWFGDWENNRANASKVVDWNGEPLVVYHGTKADFSHFNPDQKGKRDVGDIGAGIYFTANNKLASIYAYKESDHSAFNEGGNIIPVFLNIRNPMKEGIATFLREPADTELRKQVARIVTEEQSKPKSNPEEEIKGWAFFEHDEESVEISLRAKAVTKTAKQNGYDGIWAKNPRFGYVELVAFYRSQIKSAIGNTGGFNPDNPDIRYSESPLDENSVKPSWDDSSAQQEYIKEGVSIKGKPQKVFLKAKEAEGKPLDEDAAPEIKQNLRGMSRADMVTLATAHIKSSREIQLALRTRRDIVKLHGDLVPEIRVYEQLVQAYSADANEMQAKAGEVTDRWAKLDKDVSDRLADIAHLATATGVDPSLDQLAEKWNEASAKQAYQDEFAAAAKELRRLEILVKSMPGNALTGRKKELWDELKHAKKNFERLSRPWAERTFVKRKKKEEIERAAAFKQLHPLFAALPEAAQKIFRESRDMYNKQWADVEQALVDRIERSGSSEKTKKENITELRLLFRAKLPDIYFPLARQGKYVLVVKNAKNENEAVLFAESLPQAERLHKELQAKYADTDKEVMPIGKKQAKSAQDMVSGKFVSDVLDLLGTDNGGPSLDALREQIMQMYLEALPDLSWAKHEIHRKNVPGYSRDARRAFASAMMHGASHLSRIRYVDQLEKALDEAQAGVNEHKYDEGYDAVRAQDVVNEMRLRHDNIMNPPNIPEANKLTAFGFFMLLGFSPAAAMVNGTQTLAVGLPVLGGAFGFRKATYELHLASFQILQAMGGKNLQQVVNVFNRLAHGKPAGQPGDALLLNALSKVVKTPEEMTALKRGIDEGHITVTLSHELAGVSQGKKAGISDQIMRGAGYMFHVVEMFNRMATLLAAYRMAMQDEYSHEGAYQKAVELTYDSHGDYAAANRARFMEGPVARVLLLFKQYALFMTYTVLDNGAQAALALNDLAHRRPVTGQRKQAARTFAGLMTLQALITGYMGLPFVSTLLWGAGLLWGNDEDDPYDPEVALRLILADKFGSGVAEMMVHGVLRGLHSWVLKNGRLDRAEGAAGYAPFDVAGRIGLDHLWLPDLPEGLDWNKWEQAVEHAFGGPVPGTLSNAARGADTAHRGQPVRGIEEAAPVAIRNILKAWRYHQEGVQDKTGVVILDDTSLLEEIAQLIGLSPARVKEAYEARSAEYDQKKRLDQRHADLTREFAQAVKTKDEKAMAEIREEISRYNKLNPQKPITGTALVNSIIGREKRIAEAKEGIYLPKNEAKLRELGRFFNGN